MNALPLQSRRARLRVSSKIAPLRAVPIETQRCARVFVAVDPVEEVNSGRSQFSVAWLEQTLEARSANKTVTLVGQIFTRAGYSLLAYSKEVKTPKDLIGKIVRTDANRSGVSRIISYLARSALRNGTPTSRIAHSARRTTL